MEIKKRVIKGNDINTEIYNTLNKLSNSVGQTITEYHWREFCELMKMMEDEKMVEIVFVDYNTSEEHKGKGIFCDDCGEEIYGLYEDNEDGTYTCMNCLIKQDDIWIL